MRRPHRITSRQRRVVYLVADGCSNKDIAHSMGVSEAAIKKHLEALCRRYGVSSRAAIVGVAVERGEIRLSLRRRLSPRPVEGRTVRLQVATSAHSM